MSPCNAHGLCNVHVSHGDVQHTLIACRIRFAYGLRQGIIIQALVVIVVLWLQKIIRAHCNTLFGVMIFCEVKGAVGGSASPIYNVLTLPDVVTDPIKRHIHYLGSFLFHRFFGNTAVHAVVGDHRGGQLGVDQFFKGGVYWRNLFAIVKKGDKFSLRSAIENFVHNFAVGNDSADHERGCIIRILRLVGIRWIVA